MVILIGDRLHLSANIDDLMNLLLPLDLDQITTIHIRRVAEMNAEMMGMEEKGTGEMIGMQERKPTIKELLGRETIIVDHCHHPPGGI